MGQAIVQFGKAGSPSRHGSIVQVFESGGKVEELNTGVSSVASTITAEANDVCVVTNNSGGLIWATFGESPTAAVETTHPILDGTSRDFGPIGEGQKCALIDDS